MKDIPPIEPVPRLYGHCKTLAIILTASIFLAPIILSLLFWYIYSLPFLIVFGIFIFFEIVFGMITSKLRIMSITPDQGEISYSTYEVATWYVDKYLCPKRQDDKLLGHDK